MVTSFCLPLTMYRSTHAPVPAFDAVKVKPLIMPSAFDTVLPSRFAFASSARTCISVMPAMISPLCSYRFV